MATLPTQFDQFIAYSDGDTGLNENTMLRRAANFAAAGVGFGASSRGQHDAGGVITADLCGCAHERCLFSLQDRNFAR